MQRSRLSFILLVTLLAAAVAALFAGSGTVTTVVALPTLARTYGEQLQPQQQQQVIIQQQPQQQQQQQQIFTQQQQYQNQNNQQQQCDTVEICGVNLNQDQCLQYGCCWNGYTCLLPTPAPSCDVAPQNRSACGWPGITPQECTSYGCCWLPPQAGEYAPFCYYKPGQEPVYQPQYPQPNCNVTIQLPCAALGNRQQVTESECVAHGCCFDSNYYWSSQLQQQHQNNQNGICYEPLGTCYVDANERQNCGFPGISSHECFQRGCCFEPIYPYQGADSQALSQIPWCYYKQPMLSCPSANQTVCGQECCDPTQTCVLSIRQAQLQVQQNKNKQWQSWEATPLPTTLPSNTNCACRAGYQNCGKLSTPLWYGFERLLCCPPEATCGTDTCICPEGTTFTDGMCA
jgi:hypothetical protein